MDDVQETYRKTLKLLSQLVVALVIILPLFLFTWLPWPIALLLCAAIYISAPLLGAILREKWIAHRRATPVYQPPAPFSDSEQQSYRRGYQANLSPQYTTQPTQQSQPLPKEASPGLVYEDPLIQYPD